MQLNDDAPDGISALSENEIDSVGGGPIPFAVIPLVVIATHLASEYYHHHT